MTKNEGTLEGMGLPRFRRAREYHLYDDKGNRFLDLWQNNGRAVMGHRPGKFSHYLKDSISKGLWMEVPDPMQIKLIRLLLKLFPHYSYGTCFRNRERALAALAPAIPKNPLQSLIPSMRNLKTDPSILDWRPMLPDHPHEAFLLIHPPLPGFAETLILLSTTPLEEGDIISPVLLEGLIRLFHDFDQWKQHCPEYRDYSHSGRGLLQKGPYLILQKEPNDYKGFHHKALNKGILLPPLPKYPLMIPPELSDYESKLLEQFLEEALSSS